MLKPARYMTPKVPTSDSGTATLGMRVPETVRRKTKITITTSAIDSISSNCTSCTEARMVTVRSVSSCVSTDPGSAAVSAGSSCLHAVHHLDHVGARLALHVHDDGGRVVHPRGEVRVLGAVDDVGDVREVDRRAVAVGDDDRAVLGGAAQLVVGVDGVGARGAVEAALGLVHVGRGDGGAHVVHRQALRGRGTRVHLHAHGGALAARERDQAHARRPARSSARGACRPGSAPAVIGIVREVMPRVRIGASAGFTLL